LPLLSEPCLSGLFHQLVVKVQAKKERDSISHTKDCQGPTKVEPDSLSPTA
jgi:hypothetical protein